MSVGVCVRVRTHLGQKQSVRMMQCNEANLFVGYYSYDHLNDERKGGNYIKCHKPSVFISIRDENSICKTGYVSGM